MKQIAVGLALGAVMAVAAPSAMAHERGLTAVRAISDRYHDEARAIAHGFARTDACVEAPGLGYMGYHYVNHDRVDRRLEPGRPEVMLYREAADGTRQLTGVEYLVIDADQDLTTDGDRPSLFGHAFDGPMPGHEPGMPVHYDLHVWAWADNPAGTWAPWNTDPGLGC